MCVVGLFEVMLGSLVGLLFALINAALDCQLLEEMILPKTVAQHQALLYS